MLYPTDSWYEVKKYLMVWRLFSKPGPGLIVRL